MSPLNPSVKLNRCNDPGAVLIELLLTIGLLLLLIFATVALSQRVREHAKLLQVNRAAGIAIVRQCGALLRNDGHGLEACMQEVADAVFTRFRAASPSLTIMFSAYDLDELPSMRFAYATAHAESASTVRQTRFSPQRVAAEMSDLLSAAGVVIIIESMAVVDGIAVPFASFMPSAVVYEVAVL